jgi:hypothetical protein
VPRAPNIVPALGAPVSESGAALLALNPARAVGSGAAVVLRIPLKATSGPGRSGKLPLCVGFLPGDDDDVLGNPTEQLPGKSRPALVALSTRSWAPSLPWRV